MIIVLSNLYMTGGVLFAERRLRLSPPRGRRPPKPADPLTETDWTPSCDEVEHAADEATPALPPAAPAARPPRFSPAADFADEPAPTNMTDWMARVFGLRRADREAEYIEMIRASYLSEPLFWVQAALGAAICALGLVLDQTAIVIGGALIVPLVRPVIATGLALAAGDLYLLAKLVMKLAVFAAMVVVISAALIDLLPFGVTTAEIADAREPHHPGLPGRALRRDVWSGADLASPARVSLPAGGGHRDHASAGPVRHGLRRSGQASAARSSRAGRCSSRPTSSRPSSAPAPILMLVGSPEGRPVPVHPPVEGRGARRRRLRERSSGGCGCST